MRQIGSISNEPEAQRFAAYLITQGISALAEADGDAWAIWVHDENQLQKSKEELEQFRLDPSDPRYSGAVRQADALKRQEVQKREQAQKNIVEMRGRWGRPAVKKRPLTLVLIGMCVLVAIVTSFSRDRDRSRKGTFGYDTFHQLTFVDNRPENRSSDPLAAIKRFEVWRVVTPVFVHGSEMHLIFNMIWLFILGSQIETRRGTLKLATLVLSLAAISNLIPCAFPAAVGAAINGIGFSGVIYGLLGYIWIKSLFEPELGLQVSRITMILMAAWIVIGFTGRLDGMFGDGTARVDNWGHLIGLGVGLAISYAPVFVKSLRRTSD